MAEEKKDQEQQGPIGPFEQAVAPPPLSNSKNKSVYQRFDDYHQAVMKLKVVAANNYAVAQNDVKKAGANATQKCDMWKKLEIALDEYASMNKEIVTPLSQGTVDLNTNIEAANTHFDSLTGKMEDSVACVKGLYKKLLNLESLMSVLDNSMKDACNQKELKDMSKVSGALQKIEEVKCAIDGTIKKAFSFSEDITRAAGIKGLVNIKSSLVGMGEEIKKEVEAFAGQVAESLASSYKQEAASYLLANEALVAESIAESELSLAQALSDSLADVVAFSEPDNKRESPWTMEDIIKKAEKNMDLVDNNG